MTDEEFNEIAKRALAIVRKSTPHKTNNLRMNATRMRPLGDGKIMIYVDLAIAPYAKRVNGARTLGKSGVKNKNYGYWRRAAKRVVADIAAALGGKLE